MLTQLGLLLVLFSIWPVDCYWCCSVSDLDDVHVLDNLQKVCDFQLLFPQTHILPRVILAGISYVQIERRGDREPVIVHRDRFLTQTVVQTATPLDLSFWCWVWIKVRVATETCWIRVTGFTQSLLIAKFIHVTAVYKIPIQMPTTNTLFTPDTDWTQHNVSWISWYKNK